MQWPNPGIWPVATSPVLQPKFGLDGPGRSGYACHIDRRGPVMARDSPSELMSRCVVYYRDLHIFLLPNKKAEELLLHSQRRLQLNFS